ncbi:MAG: hypothetical protein C5B52_16060 [Bacteroidetes bacterium]|nr:MAG: hypothetical protein C5B52_16060 [Bacteroidota bacterium]
MRKPVLLILALGILTASYTQDNSVKNKYRKKPSLGFHFTLHDFATAAAIKNTSISKALDNNQWHNLNTMSSGLAGSYLKGLNDFIDFNARLGISSVTYPIPNKTTNENAMLLESDANLNFKLFSDQYWVSPYASVGVGASKWKGYYGAYLPLGLGFTINLSEGGYLMFSSAYRVAVTSSTTASHFFYSFGVGFSLGGKDKGEAPASSN